MKKLWRLRTSHNFGKIGEILAIIFLLFKGYKIIAHNHRNYFGEIDIIAKKGKNLVFLEVKSRKKIFDVRQVVSFWQQKRIVNAGDYFWAYRWAMFGWRQLNGEEFVFFWQPTGRASRSRSHLNDFPCPPSVLWSCPAQPPVQQAAQ
mgnify:CR=1 FL=1